PAPPPGAARRGRRNGSGRRSARRSGPARRTCTLRSLVHYSTNEPWNWRCVNTARPRTRLTRPPSVGESIHSLGSPPGRAPRARSGGGSIEPRRVGQWVGEVAVSVGARLRG